MNSNSNLNENENENEDENETYSSSFTTASFSASAPHSLATSSSCSSVRRHTIETPFIDYNHEGNYGAVSLKYVKLWNGVEIEDQHDNKQENIHKTQESNKDFKGEFPERKEYQVLTESVPMMVRDLRSLFRIFHVYCLDLQQLLLL